MAGICCGVAGESEPAVSVEPSSRASRRRRFELRSFNLVPDVAPLENDRKRKRIDLFPTIPAPALEKTKQSCEANDIKRNCINNNENLVEKNEKGEDSVDVNPKFGMTSVCGRRRDMEDAVSIRPSFCEQDQTHFYGVFDGHGCSHVAMKCKDRLHEILKEEIVSCKDGEESVMQWKEKMERSFEKMDKEVQELTVSSKISNCRCELRTPQCDAVGSTAVVAVVTPEKIVVSNCGDSRAVLCRNGVAVPLSIDHKPDRPDEMMRIEAAGGRVIFWDGPRVLGVLAMSRAIGDNYLKPFVISEPEVSVTKRTAEDECLILASDGLWDVVSNETACNVVQTCFRAQKVATAIAAAVSPVVHPGSEVAIKGQMCDKACLDASILLTKLALARHTSDNVSVVVVDLRRNRNQPQKL